MTDVQTTAAAAPDRSARTDAHGALLRRLWDRASLLWRVFIANAAVFVVAMATIAWTPVTVHRIATPHEVVVLAIGLVLMLAIDLFLLRRALAPLRRLAATMTAVDPSVPGRRADLSASSGQEVLALGGALNEMLDRLETERREHGRQVLAAQEEERMRIARELHDEVGQTLTAIALRAERAADGAGSGTAALREIGETALRSLEDVRRIGRELRPEALDDLGLVNALIALCSRITGQGSLRLRRRLEWHLPPLSPEVELVIYRTAQEALTNTLRHAQATEACVALSRGEDGFVTLAVSDNGRGLPSVRTEQGLRGMRERAHLIDAKLEVRSAPGNGTEILLTVPSGSA